MPGHRSTRRLLVSLLGVVVALVVLAVVLVEIPGSKDKFPDVTYCQAINTMYGNPLFADATAPLTPAKTARDLRELAADIVVLENNASSTGVAANLRRYSGALEALADDTPLLNHIGSQNVMSGAVELKYPHTKLSAMVAAGRLPGIAKATGFGETIPVGASCVPQP